MIDYERERMLCVKVANEGYQEKEYVIWIRIYLLHIS